MGFNIAQQVHQIFTALLETEMCRTECQLLAGAGTDSHISRDEAEGDVLQSSPASPGQWEECGEVLTSTLRGAWVPPVLEESPRK